MPFSMMVLFFLLFLNFCIISMGVVFYQQYDQKKPSISQLILLMLQIVLLVLFFSDSLRTLPTALFHVLWWGIVGTGLFVGVRNIKHHAIISTFHLLFSFFFGVVMVLILFVASM